MTNEVGEIVAKYAYDDLGNMMKNTATTEEIKVNSYGYVDIRSIRKLNNL
nr:hypothetical protein [Listeria innocua]